MSFGGQASDNGERDPVPSERAVADGDDTAGRSKGCGPEAG
jgi:hypothetical protein